MTLEETYEYGDARDEVLACKPGITGWWAATDRNDSTWESGVRQARELWERWRKWALLRSSPLTAVGVLRFSISPPCSLLPRICNRDSGVIHVPQIYLWDMDG